jgi:hypothetical protein
MARIRPGKLRKFAVKIEMTAETDNTAAQIRQSLKKMCPPNMCVVSVDEIPEQPDLKRLPPQNKMFA